jgi:hypothetical protein
MDIIRISVVIAKQKNLYSYKLFVGFWLCFWLVLPVAQAQEATWTLQKEKSGVSVYKRPFKKKKGKETKAVMEVEASVASLVALVKDSEAGPQWLSRINVFKTFEELSPAEWYTYAEASLPFPYTNRDLITLNSIWQDSLSKTVRVYLKGDWKKLPEKEGLVRIKEAEGFWQFRPINAQKTEVVYQFYAEPHLDLPAWIKDPIIANGLITTMKNMRQQVAKSKYQKVKSIY